MRLPRGQAAYCHHAGKAHEALERGSDDSEAAGAWHIPAGPRQEGNVAAKMGRREAWARFLAYDVSALPPLDFRHPASSVCVIA